MGNDMAYKIVGISLFKIKMYDEIVRTLPNIWHIPKLHMHLGHMSEKGMIILSK